MRTDKMHPIPWEHKTDGKKMSAVVDADGHVVCGSLICQQADATKQRQTHAYIVQKANNTALPPKRRGRQELARFRLLAGVCGHRSPPVVCYHPDNPGTRGSFRCGGKCAKGVCPIWRDIHKAEDV